MLPLATHCHTHYHLHPFHFMLSKFKGLVAKQHPTNSVSEYLQRYMQLFQLPLGGVVLYNDVGLSLVPRRGGVGGESAWYTLFAHALNRHGIPWRLCSYV